ncbi:MAG: methyltransferase domain-containing protein [Candidatus Omnitrophota bacterium]
MHEKYSDYFICPQCSQLLTLKVFKSEAFHLRDGIFCCSNQEHLFPLMNGVPRMLSPELLATVIDSDKLKNWISIYSSKLPEQYFKKLDNLLYSVVFSRKAKTASYYAFQWKKYDAQNMTTYDEAEFLRLTGGLLDTNEYAEKSIIDAGAGQGRFTGLFLDVGIKKIVCFDLSEAIELAYEKYNFDERVLCVQTDIFNLPITAKQFDLAICIGVLQHLPDPYKGFISLCSMAKPGGRVFAWTYNVSVVTHVIQAIRMFCSWLPIKLIWHVATIVTLPRYVLALIGKFLRVIKLNRVADSLPLSQYEGYSFHYLHVNSFDFLHTPIINYFTRNDLKQWMEKSCSVDYKLIERFPRRAGASWIIDVISSG